MMRSASEEKLKYRAGLLLLQRLDVSPRSPEGRDKGISAVQLEEVGRFVMDLQLETAPPLY